MGVEEGLPYIAVAMAVEGTLDVRVGGGRRRPCECIVQRFIRSVSSALRCAYMCGVLESTVCRGVAAGGAVRARPRTLLGGKAGHLSRQPQSY